MMLEVKLLINVLATMDKFFTERSLDNKNWSNFKSNLKFIIMTTKDYQTMFGVNFLVKVSATMSQLRTKKSLAPF